MEKKILIKQKKKKNQFLRGIFINVSWLKKQILKKVIIYKT